MSVDKPVPDAAFSPFEDLVHFLGDHDVVMHMHMRALRMVEGTVELSKAVSSARKSLNQKPLDRDLNDEISFESRCRAEVELGFPHLTSHSVVLLWASLESAFEQFIVNLLRDVPELIDVVDIGKFKIPADLALAKNSDAIAKVVYQELSRSLNSSQNWGISRFLLVIEKLKIPASYDKSLIMDLKEFVATRNIIVHKRSVCDDKFLSACPWVNVQKGQTVLVSIDDYTRFRVAVSNFVSSLIKAATSEDYAKVLGR